MTNYTRGAAFEREVKDDLIKKGLAAVRSAGSHGAADVMAYHYGIGLFVQCKRDGRLPLDERRKLVLLAKKHNAIPVLADKRKRGVITYYWLTVGKREPFRPGALVLEV